MSATSITQSVQTLQSNIYEHVHHRALRQNVGQPTLQQEQLFFLQLPFLNSRAMTEEQMKSAVAVGIVHASLLEHEKVKELEATSKQQQLTVLSGDYYSGRYYQILAQTGNIPLVQKLSQGIVERCEHQVRVYETARPLQEWVESLTVIESTLIAQFYSVYNFTQYTELMQQALTCVRLQHECDALAHEQPCFMNKALQLAEPAWTVAQVTSDLQHELAVRRELVEKLLQASTLSEELKQTIMQYVTIS